MKDNIILDKQTNFEEKSLYTPNTYPQFSIRIKLILIEEHILLDKNFNKSRFSEN